jgi:hypothetical protein
MTSSPVRATSIYRADPTNVGDAMCAPMRAIAFEGAAIDILTVQPEQLSGLVVVGGGGLIAETFAAPMRRIAQTRHQLTGLVAWGVGESLLIDRRGGMVMPYAGALPDYLDAFDLVGLRDYGTGYRWVPCASCLLPEFDLHYAPASHPFVIYEHKRIRIPIDGFPMRTNTGNDFGAVLAFLASGETIITNSYHGAYWATLLGRRVIAVANMSKMYRLKHAPIIARPDRWRRVADLTSTYPDALAECRAANLGFHKEVLRLMASAQG